MMFEPLRAQAAHELAGVDFDRAVGFLHAHADGRLRGVRPRNHFERSVGRASPGGSACARPLEGAVGPVSQRPALQRLQLLVGAAQREIFRFALFAARPRRAPGDALRDGAGAAIEPAHPGAGARIGHGYGRGWRALRRLTGDHSKGCGSGTLLEMNCRREMRFFIVIPPVGASCSHRIVVPDRICTMLIESAKISHDL